MKLRLLLTILVVVVCSFTRPTSAAAPVYTDPLLDRLVGTWVLRGQIARKDTTHDVVAEWVLDHQYVRLHEVAREKDGKGNAAYEAIVFIGTGRPAHEYTCLWLDSTGGGGLVPEGFGHAMRVDGEIPFVFLDGSGKISFKNTFAYDKGTDSWAWIMDNVVDGKAKPFGRVKMTRR